MKIIKNFGDVTKINGAEVPLVDIITYGAPCQDLSVAGKRAGMKNVIMGDEDSTRSGLFFDAIRIIKEMRNESIKQLSMRGAAYDVRCVRPRYTVYENVPGAFSSNGGEDFRAVLEETCKVVDENAHVPRLEKGQRWASAGCIMGDGYSVAWRIHDARWHGVPQRRKRLCVLADYGGGTAPEILFELIGETDDPETFKAIADIGKQSKPQVQSVTESVSGDSEQGRETWEETAGTSSDSIGKTGTGGGIETFDVRISSEGTKNQRAHCYETDRSRALDTGGENPDSNHGGIAIVEHWTIDEKMGNTYCHCEEANTLGARNFKQPQATVQEKCLNPWDVQSKHIQPKDGVAEALYSGECRYGGGESYVLDDSEPILLESNQNHATVQTDGVCTALPASMGMGGGYVPMVVGADLYNHQLTGETAATLNASSSNSPTHSGPSVVCFEGGSASRVGGHVYEESTGTLRANAGDNQQCVCVGADMYNQTLTGEETMSITGAATDSHHVPCVVSGVDCYNLQATGEVAKTITSGREDKNNIPCVACYTQDSYDKLSESENSASLRASGGNYGGGTETIVIQ